MPETENPLLQAVWLGQCDYDRGHQVQLETLELVASGSSPATLLLLEHEPVITFGRRGSDEDLRVPLEEFAQRGIAVRRVERGGLVTYHGPGQLVGYIIAPVRELARDLPTFVWQIEEGLILAMAQLGVAATHDLCHRGVWVGEAKLASIGLAVQHGVSWHGFALNVWTDLGAFDLIRACGLDTETTSLHKLVEKTHSVQDVARAVATQLATVWGCELGWVEELRSER